MSEELKPEEIEALKRAMDEVSEQYAEDNQIIFENESARAKLRFGTLHKRLREWGKAKRCLVPGCTRRSISRSHAVPKGMSLSEIAEVGHVLVPALDHTTEELCLQRVGISEATTFPGFCGIHELLFEEFENKKAISTEFHATLQAYRVACRELTRTKFVVEQHDWMMVEYGKARDAGFARLIRERAISHGLPVNFPSMSASFNDDPIDVLANERIAPVRDHARHIETELLPALEKAVFSNDHSGVYAVALFLDIQIPVALAGSAPFSIKHPMGEASVPLLISVVPSMGRTLLLMAATTPNKDYVDVYQAYWMQHALRFLSMVEAWMINGTDQWCITPSVWSNLPQSRKAELLRKLFSSELNIGSECSISIFDDLRTRIIALSDAANEGEAGSAYLELIARERAKLT